MSERVFVSSTCFDLIDVRHEVEVHLRDLGLSPVLSDRPTSEFEVDPYKDSIATCLVNVRSADHFVCILSQRYGPRLGAVGFPDISATHLEYREAKAAARPILFLVRDRLVGDYDTWKKNGRTTTTRLPWIPTANDVGLLELLDEHAALVAGSATSNWYTPFTSVVDLKDTLRRQLHARSLRAAVRRLVDWPDAPWLTPLQVDAAGNCIGLHNAGKTPALNVEAALAGLENWESLSHILPGTSARFNLNLQSLSTNPWLVVRYTTVTGYRAEDQFDVKLERSGRLLVAFREKKVLSVPAPAR